MERVGIMKIDTEEKTIYVTTYNGGNGIPKLTAEEEQVKKTFEMIVSKYNRRVKNELAK